MQTPDLSALLARVGTQRDLDALGTLFDQSAPGLLRLALRVTGDPIEAEDVLQETFLAVWKGARTYDPSRPAGAWLAAVLTNVAARRHRKRRPGELPVRTEASAGAETVGGLGEDWQRTREAIQALPARERSAMLLRYEHGLAPERIAEILSLNGSSVRSLLTRGLRRLRGRLLPVVMPLPLQPRITSSDVVARVRDRVLAMSGPGAGVSGAMQATTILGTGGVLMGSKQAIAVGVVVLLAGVGGWGLLRADWGRTDQKTLNMGAEGELPTRLTSREPPAEAVALAAGGSPVPAVETISRTAPTSWATARDLATGLPVPGLSLSWTPSGSQRPEEVRGDATGRIRLPPDSGAVLELADGWQVASRARSPDGDLWIYRWLSIEGTIHLEGATTNRPFDPRRLRVSTVALGPPNESLAVPAQDLPSSTDRLRQLGLYSRTVNGNHQYPRYAIRVPRTRWIGIRADAPGWRSDLKEVFTPDLAEQPTLRLDLVLRPTIAISGVLTDEAGLPIVGGRLRVQLMRRSTAAGVNPGRLDQYGYASTMIGNPDGTVVLTYMLEVSAEQDGTYSVDVPPGDGEVLLLANAPGFTPARLEMGPVTADAQRNVKLHRPSDLPGTLVKIGKASAAGEPLVVTDITDLDRQTYLGTLIVGDDGSLPVEWFEAGRSYWLVARKSGHHAYFRWASQPLLDLEILPHDLETFKKQ